MKQVTLNIPDTKLHFFMELIKSLSFIKPSDVQTWDVDSDVPEFHKKIIAKRLKSLQEDPKSTVKWSDAKKKFKMD